MRNDGALGGTRTHDLYLRRVALYPLSYKRTRLRRNGNSLVPRAGFEPARPCGHYALNVARLPFRHLGLVPTRTSGPCDAAAVAGPRVRRKAVDCIKWDVGRTNGRRS